MIGLRDNLLTTLLGAIAAGLVLVALGLLVLFGRADLDRIGPEGDTSVPRVEVAVAGGDLEPFDEYGEIIRRPVFFSDRRLPVIEVASVEEPEPEPEPVEEEVEEEPVPDLKAVVAGIIITSDLRMAMIQDQEANKTVIMREGMSLGGEQAAWRIDRIASRQVDFVSADGQRTGLELKVNTRGLTVPSAQRRAPERQEARAADEEIDGNEERPELDEDARTRAEEIRSRVAERRAELRAEAERRAREQQDD